MIEINVSESYKREVKKETIVAIVLFSLMLVLLPSIIFIDYWYYTIAIGAILIPFWIKFRWNVYKKELRGIENHKLTFEGEVLNFHYENSKYLIDLPKSSQLKVNIKKRHIDSIRLILPDGNNVILTKYEKMDKILKYLQSIVGEKNTSFHRWFHKY